MKYYPLCCQDLGDQVKDGDSKGTNGLADGSKEAAKKKIIVPKNCNVPIRQEMSNIFDPKLCKGIDWSQKDIGAQSAPLAEAKKPVEVEPASGGSEKVPSFGPPVSASGPPAPSNEKAAEKAQQQYVQAVLAAARSGLLLYPVMFSVLFSMNNDSIAVEFLPETCARVGKAPGTYDKYDHQQLVEECVEFWGFNSIAQLYTIVVVSGFVVLFRVLEQQSWWKLGMTRKNEPWFESVALDLWCLSLLCVSLCHWALWCLIVLSCWTFLYERCKVKNWKRLWWPQEVLHSVKW